MNQRKSSWLVKGATLQDLHRFAKATYEAKVSRFLATHLQ